MSMIQPNSPASMMTTNDAASFPKWILNLKVDPSLELMNMLRGSANQPLLVHCYGDSGTAGVGSTGNNNPSTNPIIYNDGLGNGVNNSFFYEADYVSPCWVNYLRTYLGTNFSNVGIVNKGIGGKSAKWGNTNKLQWVTTCDIAIVMLGTNDRFDSADVYEFKRNYIEFLDYVDKNSKLMIVMSPWPALTDFADDTYTTLNPAYHFGTKEIDGVVTDICIEKGYTQIPLYRNFLDRVALKGIGLTSVLQARTVGSHMIDGGYKLAWNIMQKQLGFVDNTGSWNGLNNIVPYSKNQLLTLSYATTGYDATTPAFDAYYVNQIGSGDANIAQYPESGGGVLELYRGDNGAYIWETYYPRNSGRTYRRYWNYVSDTSGSWSVWTAVGIGFKDGYNAQAVGFNTSITAYADGESKTLIASNHPDIALFPGSLQGEIFTMRNSSSETFSYQRYTPNTGNDMYIRHWSGSAWGNFTAMTGANTNNLIIQNTSPRLFTDGITAYPAQKVEYNEIGSSNTTLASFPEGAKGLLITYRGFTDIYTYQEYRLRSDSANPHSIYHRYWDFTNSLWSAFVKISAV